MTAADDLFALIDPWAALLDGRVQLLSAIEVALIDGQELAEILGIAAARDRALHDVARAYAEGARDFAHVDAPAARVRSDAHDATIDAHAVAEEARAELLDAIGALENFFDEVVETSWGGRDTWRMHLVTQAMHDAADAQSIRDQRA